MTQEEKQLLLVDLCTRASYGVNCLFKWSYTNETTGGEEVIAEQIDTIKSINFHIKEVEANYYGEWIGVEDCKPYLRPMSSMTEEERMEFTKLFDKWHDDELFDYIEEGVEFSIWKHKGISAVVFDWFNKKMFDYRGLIPMGLALPAPEDMYSTKTE